MTEKEAISRACALTGDDVEAVLGSHFDGETLSIVVDRGIKGGPKFTFTVDELKAKAEPEKAEAEKAEPEKAEAKKDANTSTANSGNKRRSRK